MSKPELYCVLFVTTITIILSAFAGFNLISASNVQRHEIPCKLLNISAFSCDYNPSMNQYHSATSMVLQIKKTNVSITMADNCMSCFDCKKLYTSGTTYNCALTDGKYTIYDCNHTTNYALVILGVIFLIFSTSFVIILICALISLRLHSHPVKDDDDDVDL